MARVNTMDFFLFPGHEAVASTQTQGPETGTGTGIFVMNLFLIKHGHIRNGTTTATKPFKAQGGGEGPRAIS